MTWRVLPAMDATLYGREHLSRFLTSWYTLLFDLQPNSPAASPIEVVHFGGSHVQAGRIGWAFRQRLSEDRPGIAVGCGIQVPPPD